MREYNTEDQWSESKRTLCSKPYQQKLGKYYSEWKREDPMIVSDDDLVDAFVNEVTFRNKADLFDFKKIYIDPERREVLQVLCEDTRHQIGRLLAKAEKFPERRLWASLIEFYMWLDLAMKCREARKKLKSNSTKS